jgi:NCS1 family nucleobase:cation symporter-1
LSSTLGVPAGTLLATFLLLRHVAWATFALAFATEAATHVPGAGDSAVLWGIAFGAAGLALALLPAQTFVRRWMGWFAFWVGLLLIALFTVTGVFSYGIPVLHDADGMGGWPTLAQGFDLVAAMPLLWLPVVADYTRDARSPRDAAGGAFAGAGIVTAWFVILGLLWVFTVNARDAAQFVTALPVGIGGLVVILALEADQVAANVYAASMAGGRFGYRYFRPALMAAGALAAVFVVTTNAMGVEDFALMLSNIFLPLFGVVLARHLIPEAPKAFAWAAWLLGVFAFGWINPSTVGPWHDAMKVVYVGILQAPFPLGGELTQAPATAVSLAVAFGGYLLVSWPWWFFRREF